MEDKEEEKHGAGGGLALVVFYKDSTIRSTAMYSYVEVIKVVFCSFFSHFH